MPLSNPSAEELYTVVQNPTDVERTIGFLGPRGMTLAAGEVVAIPGDLVATLGAQAARGSRRKFDGLERALKAGRLQINSRPAPVLFDSVDERPKSLAIAGGSLGVVDPAYGDDDSDSFEAV
jgi:hypothetical protein